MQGGQTMVLFSLICRRVKVIVSCAFCPNNDLNDVLDGVWKVADEGTGNLCVDQAAKSFIELKIQSSRTGMF